MTTLTLSPAQDAALSKLNTWLTTAINERVRGVALSQPWFYLAGYAGTGKTTIIDHLQQPDTLYGAYTGKAALRMRQVSGVDAHTIHRLIYSLIPPDTVKIRELKELLQTASNEREKRRIAVQLGEALRPKFSLNQEKSPLNKAALLVIDECSMVSEELAQDLLSFRVPIIVLGDPGQLPPVKGEGFFTAKAPDVFLEEIHRQAEGSPIIAFSKYIREKGAAPIGFSDEATRVGRTAELPYLQRADQVLVGKHVTRVQYNRVLRQMAGRTSQYPMQDDKLICLRNDYLTGLINGLYATAQEDAGSPVGNSFSFPILTEDGSKLEDLDISSIPFEPLDLQKVLFPRKGQTLLDYGYAITVHKSQGSQFNNVVLKDDAMFVWDGAMRTKWLYTAVTRAIDTVYIL